MNTVTDNNNHPSNLRLSRLRDFLKCEGVDFYIITTSDPHMSEYLSPVDKIREYFSGFTGSAGTLVISCDNALLWTDGRYHIQAQRELKNSKITLMKDGIKGVPSVFEYLKKVVKGGGVIGFDGRYLSIEYAERLKQILGDCVIYRSDIAINDDVWPERDDRIFNKVFSVDDKTAGCMVSEKLNGVRDKLECIYPSSENEVILIISDLNDIMYLLNLRGSDVEYVPVAFSYMILFSDKVYLYLGDNVLTDTEKNKFISNNVFVKKYDDFYRDLGQIKNSRVVIDKSICNSRIYDEVENDNQICFCKNYDFVLKHIKNRAEIENFKKYHIEDAIAMIRFIRTLKEEVMKHPGKINEYDAAGMLDTLRLGGNNCTGLSFETISAYGENGAVVHYSAPKEGSSKLYDRGFYLVDSGGHYPSCTTDITRTIALGELSEYEKKCYTAVLRGNLALSGAIFPQDTRPENLDILAREPLWKMGLDYLHGTGHGIGSNLSVHEGPVAIRYRIRNNAPLPNLTEGNVISDEPGVYIEDRFGIRLENELLVVKCDETINSDFLGFEVLTLVPFEREAIVKDYLSEEEVLYLNNYHQRIFEIVSPYLDKEDESWLYDVTRPI